MLDSPTAESDANGNNRPQTQTMVIDMSGSVLRQSCVVISVLLFLAAFMFGLVATEPGRTPTVRAGIRWFLSVWLASVICGGNDQA